MRAAAIVGLAMTVGGALLAQSPQPAPTFRSGIDVVRVDVSVLDAARRPMRGLTVDDFTVQVNGQPQKVVALSEIEVPSLVPPAASWLRDVTPDVATNRLRDRRVWAIVMDDATVPGDPWVVNHAKEIARGVVERLGAGDVAAVIFSRDNSTSQEFTSDRRKLLAAIDTFASSVDPAIQDSRIVQRAPMIYGDLSLKTLSAVVGALAELPDRRKALVLISNGVGAELQSAAPVLATLEGGAPERFQAGDLIAKSSDAVRFAAANNINIYPFDPEGLPRADRGGLNARTDSLRALAANTGGRAAVNTNDATPALEQMFVENGSYYLLGFEVPSKLKSALTSLDIRVNRAGAMVRSLHQVMPVVAADKKAAPIGVAKALSGLLPVSDVPMTAAVAPFQKKGKDATVAVTLGVYGVVGAKPKDTVDLIVTAFDSDGGKQRTERTKADVVFRSGAAATTMTFFEVQSRIDLKPGRYQVRLAAHRGNTDDRGSVFTDIEVPNFEKDDLSLSGVALSMSPGPVSAPRGALSDLLPVVPTTVRDFTRDASVDSLVRIYQGGRGTLQPVTMSVQFIDTNNVVVMSRKEPIAAGQFLATRSFEYRLPLPIRAFQPGAYVMRLEAAVGKTTARRDVMFVVR